MPHNVITHLDKHAGFYASLRVWRKRIIYRNAMYYEYKEVFCQYLFGLEGGIITWVVDIIDWKQGAARG